MEFITLKISILWRICYFLFLKFTKKLNIVFKDPESSTKLFSFIVENLTKNLNIEFIEVHYEKYLFIYKLPENSFLGNKGCMPVSHIPINGIAKYNFPFYGYQGDPTIREVNKIDYKITVSDIILGKIFSKKIDEKYTKGKIDIIVNNLLHTKQPPAKAGGFKLWTESPDTRRLNDVS